MNRDLITCLLQNPLIPTKANMSVSLHFSQDLHFLFLCTPPVKANLLYYNAGDELGKRPSFLNHVSRSPYVFLWKYQIKYED